MKTVRVLCLFVLMAVLGCGVMVDECGNVAFSFGGCVWFGDVCGMPSGCQSDYYYFYDDYGEPICDGYYGDCF